MAGLSNQMEYRFVFHQCGFHWEQLWVSSSIPEIGYFSDETCQFMVCSEMGETESHGVSSADRKTYLSWLVGEVSNWESLLCHAWVRIRQRSDATWVSNGDHQYASAVSKNVGNPWNPKSSHSSCRYTRYGIIQAWHHSFPHSSMIFPAFFEPSFTSEISQEAAMFDDTEGQMVLIEPF